MEVEMIKSWRKRYNGLVRKYRRLNGSEMPLSLDEYIKNIIDMDLKSDLIGNSKGKYCFCFKFLRYKVI